MLYWNHSKGNDRKAHNQIRDGGDNMKLKLTVHEAERIACALCFCQIELEAHANEMGKYTEDRQQAEEAAQFYEQMCKRFRDAAEKSKEVVTVDIE